MAEDNICRKCKSDMKLVEEKILAGTKYNMFKCEKCNVQIARSQR